MHKKADRINLYSQYKKVISFQIWKRKFKFTYEIASSISFSNLSDKIEEFIHSIPKSTIWVHIDYFNWFLLIVQIPWKNTYSFL